MALGFKLSAFGFHRGTSTFNLKFIGLDRKSGNSLDWIGFLQDRILILHRLRTERFFGIGYLLV